MRRRHLKVLFAPVLIFSLVLARPTEAIAQDYSPDASTTAVTITLNASQVIRTIDQRMFGINTAIWDAAFETTATRSLLQEMVSTALWLGRNAHEPGMSAVTGFAVSDFFVVSDLSRGGCGQVGRQRHPAKFISPVTPASVAWWSTN